MQLAPCAKRIGDCITDWPVITQASLLIFELQSAAASFVKSESSVDANALARILLPFKTDGKFDPYKPVLRTSDFTTLEIVEFLTKRFIDELLLVWVEAGQSKLLLEFATVVRVEWDIPEDCTRNHPSGTRGTCYVRRVWLLQASLGAELPPAV